MLHINQLRTNNLSGREQICDQQFKALKLYQEGDMSSKEIADKFQISAATLTVWAKKMGVPFRGRGRRAHVCPSLSAQLILLEAWTSRYTIAAKKFAVTKQWVGYLVKRWRAWANNEFGPRDLRLQNRHTISKK